MSTTAALQQRWIESYTWRYAARGYQDMEPAARTRWPPRSPLRPEGATRSSSHLWKQTRRRTSQPRDSENREPGTPNRLHTVTTNPAGRVHTGKGLGRQWTDDTDQGKCCAGKNSHNSTSFSFSLLLFTYVVLFYSRRTSFLNGICSDISLPPLSPKALLAKGCCRRTRTGGGLWVNLRLFCPQEGVCARTVSACKGRRCTVISQFLEAALGW